MRYIDLETWPRREQFQVFRDWGYPHFSICANLDLTTFYPLVKGQGTSFTTAVIYILARAANEIPEFRYRIRGEGVVEHGIVHPSTTILVNEDMFSFCLVNYSEDFSIFAARAAERIDFVRKHPNLEDEPGRDDYLYMTAIPWVSFTSFMHPLDLDHVDSVPRFAWGKLFEDGDNLMMPISVQGHHALMDGFHVGKYYEKVQDYLHDPDFLPGEV